MSRLSSRIGSRARNFRHWVTAKAVLAAFALLRTMSADRALNLADRWARRIGPLTPRHKIALDNLRQAYPDKSDGEIETIAVDMWGQMARLTAEYVFLDRLADFDPLSTEPGRIEVDGIDLFLKLRDEQRPRIFFTAHTGAFEMVTVVAARFGLDVAALFRAPNNPYLAAELSEVRQVSQARMIASRSGAAITLARILEDKGNVGMLVDQKFNGGLMTTFFGRPCETSPLAPRLARQFDADIYPARCIRLPGNRYRLQLEDKITPPRGENGEIDVAALAQQINDHVEGWVRQYPDQWMWFHKRWQIVGKRPRRKWKK